ncbi:hypothetical protein [Staphylococcus sp. EZ-P03]|uniref:hypothetical protein n=1 Tax=Staphylococcus sp. EZ-P03 TaxID=2282739 RepID=UPI000DF72DB2|nr:hypothetical protein [Staphylococcus sp. EZ-P03]
MFKFHKQAIQNAKPQNVKIAVFSILTFIVFILLVGLSLQPLSQAAQLVMMAMMTQQFSPQIIIAILFAVILPLAFFIFAGYHLAAGAINIIYKGINKEKVSFTDALSAFKKGSYLKAVKLALFTLLFIIILSLIRYVLTQLFSAVFGSAVRGGQNYFMEHIGAYIAVQLIALTILGLILSFFIWAITYIIVAYTAAYFKDRQAGAFKDVKQAFKSMKNGQHSWFKLLLGLVLLDFIVILLSTPIVQLVNLGTKSMSQNIANVLIIIVMVIAMLVRVAVYYLNTHAIIAFFNSAAGHLAPRTKPSHKERKAKQAAKDKKEQVEDKVEQTKDKADTEKETYSDTTFDHLESKKKDIDQRSDEFKK